LPLDAEVVFFLDHIMVRVQEAEGEILEALAHQIEGQAKANIVANDQVDTGFMLNSIYVTTESGSTHRQAEGKARAKNPSGKMATEVTAGQGKAAVVAGAEYAIFQEAKNSFLFRAAEQVGPQVGGIVEKIGKEVIVD
jgi:hypothetical protein